MKKTPTLIVAVWLLGVAAVFAMLAVGVASAQPPGSTCAAGKFVGGRPDPVKVPLPPGEYTITVRTWDTYPGRAAAWPGDQTAESIIVAGRTTPDLADGVESADWSGTWTWTSSGVLGVAHGWPGSGAHSVSWEVCATPAARTTTTTTTTPPTTTVPVAVLPEVLIPTEIAEPVVIVPAFTG